MINSRPTSALLSPRRLVAAVLLPGLLVSALALAADPPSDAPSARADADTHARQMHQRIRQLHQVLRERQQQRERHDAEVASLQQQVDRLEADHREAQQKLRERQQQVDDAERTVTTLEEAERALTGQIAATAEAAAPRAKAMQQRVAAGVPFRRDSRSEALAAAHADLLETDAPLTQADALAAFWSAAEQELQLSNATRFWNEPALLHDGRRLHAYQVRLGLVQQMLIGEDGRSVGLAAGGAEHAWQLDLPQPQRQQVLDAMLILQQQHPPELTPVPLTPAAAEPNGAAP